MNEIQFKEINLDNIAKNNLYKISSSKTVIFKEEHTDKETCEVVNLVYNLKDKQYGFYATEYRPGHVKKGSKTTDILAGIVDDEKKIVYSLICDVKSNISAFSDDLSSEGAVITAIKEVRDFILQLESEMRHKNSFMLYYWADGYAENCETAIATKNFENNKFIAVAEWLEEILNKDEKTQDLRFLKMRNSFEHYRNEILKLRDFGEEKVVINGKEYKLVVYILKPDNDEVVYEEVIELQL